MDEKDISSEWHTGSLLHPRLAFAGHCWLERCKEPFVVTLRPYKLLSPMSQVRSPLALPWPQHERRTASWSHYCSFIRESNEGTG